MATRAGTHLNHPFTVCTDTVSEGDRAGTAARTRSPLVAVRTGLPSGATATSKGGRVTRVTRGDRRLCGASVSGDRGAGTCTRPKRVGERQRRGSLVDEPRRTLRRTCAAPPHSPLTTSPAPAAAAPRSVTPSPATTAALPSPARTPSGTPSSTASAAASPTAPGYSPSPPTEAPDDHPRRRETPPRPAHPRDASPRGRLSVLSLSRIRPHLPGRHRRPRPRRVPPLPSYAAWKASGSMPTTGSSPRNTALPASAATTIRRNGTARTRSTSPCPPPVPASTASSRRDQASSRMVGLATPSVVRLAVVPLRAGVDVLNGCRRRSQSSSSA